MSDPLDGTIFGAAKKALKAGAKMAISQREKKRSRQEEEEEENEQQEIHTSKKVSGAVGKKLGKGLKKLWDSGALGAK